MDNAISHILHGCRLAREIEVNLPGLVNSAHPSVLAASCEDVVRAFNDAVGELRRLQDMAPRGEEGPQAMDLFPFYVEKGPAESEMERLQVEMFGFDIGSGSGFGSTGGGEQRREAAVVEEGSSSGFGRRPSSGSTSQRQSRKRKEKGMRTVRVPAVRVGNIENPPDDGYTWRKYGQKDILNSRFPRSYFRCTHKNFYGCEAKKQVQRLDEDPYTYEVTYCNEHTCQTSTTPIILPPLVTNNQQTDMAMMPGSTQPPSSSLSTSIQLGSAWINVSQRDVQLRGAGEGSSGAAHVGTSDCPVADFADVMFNSGSSGSSMDAIFSLKQEHWKDKEE